MRFPSSGRARSLAPRVLTVIGSAVWLTASLARAYAPMDPAGIEPAARCGKARQLAAGFQARQMREQWKQDYQAQRAAGLREALQDTDLLHCNLEIEIIPGAGPADDNLLGTNLMTIQSKSPALDTFTFRLRDQYNITGLLINGTTPVGYTTLSTTTKAVTLDRTYTMDQVFTLEISYSGQAVSPGFGSIEFTTHGGADIVYTLSEPYFAYTWWPCKDGDWGQPGDNADKFTLELAVISPDNMVTASNGLLQGVDTLSGNRVRHRWSSAYPICTYLACFSSTNYNTWTEFYTPMAGGAMPVDFYIYPEHDNSFNRDAWAVAVDALYTFRDLFGEYPFVNEKYGIYECQFGGGMEHQTFTAQGSFIESITVHELAHQWWGDMVTCRTWNHIWLNEGFASYAEALWAEFQPGSSGEPARKTVMSTMKYTGPGSVYVYDHELDDLWEIFNGSTTYDKAAWVVHMLRGVLGDQDFFDLLAAYRAAFEFDAATTEDLQAVGESFYGDSLDWFFDQWVYGEWVPQYTRGFESVQVNGKDYLLLSLDQTQPAEQQRFTMPIDIVVDGTTHLIFNDADPEHFVIPIAAPASTVQLDPGRWILRINSALGDYLPGPPKIVETSPAPGQEIGDHQNTDTITVWFHTNVNADPADLSLIGDLTGPRSFALASGTDVNPLVLNLDAPLPADSYTLAVGDAVTAVDSGQALDGEIDDPNDPASLPSGEGVAGGNALLRFTITRTLLGDFDGDFDVDLNDFATFTLCFAGSTVTTPPPGCSPAEFAAADLDRDGDADLGDFSTFAVNFTG